MLSVSALPQTLGPIASGEIGGLLKLERLAELLVRGSVHGQAETAFNLQEKNIVVDNLPGEVQVADRVQEFAERGHQHVHQT